MSLITPTAAARPRPVGLRERAAACSTAVVALLFGLWLCLLAPTVAAQDLQPVPPLSARVIDQTGTLTPGDLAALEARLQAIETTHGSQVVILMVPSTHPEDIAAYAWRVADQWKIGRRQVGDGVLLVVAKDDRRVRIEVARALEGAIPDLAARRIIDQAITPAFREGRYAAGLDAAITRLGSLIAGEGLPVPERGTGAGERGLQLNDLLVLMFIGAPMLGGVLGALLGRKLGAASTGGALGLLGWVLTGSLFAGIAAALLAMVLALALGSGGAVPGAGRGRRHPTPIIWGGGRGGGLGGGGFRSGGGGSFGGGGASGRW